MLNPPLDAKSTTHRTHIIYKHCHLHQQLVIHVSHNLIPTLTKHVHSFQSWSAIKLAVSTFGPLEVSVGGPWRFYARLVFGRLAVDYRPSITVIIRIPETIREFAQTESDHHRCLFRDDLSPIGTEVWCVGLCEEG